MSTTFDVVPPLSWDNPKDVPTLRYLERTQGEEFARIVTLPNEEYIKEVCDIMALNYREEDDKEDVASA
jgi:hypothetical protein